MVRSACAGDAWEGFVRKGFWFGFGFIYKFVSVGRGIIMRKVCLTGGGLYKLNSRDKQVRLR